MTLFFHQSSFSVSEETFFQKRQTDTVSLAPQLGPCTHVGSRRAGLAFHISGDYPGPKLLPCYPFLISVTVASAALYRLPERKGPGHWAAMHSWVTLQQHLVQAPTNTNSNNCNNLISLIRSKSTIPSGRAKSLSRANWSNKVVNWICLIPEEGLELAVCSGTLSAFKTAEERKRETFWSVSFSRSKEFLPSSSKNLIQLLKELPNHISNMTPDPIWFFAFCCLALG